MTRTVLFFIVHFLSVQISLYTQALSSEHKSLLRAQATDIGVNEEYSNGDWDSVLDICKDAQIVLLGEFTHGAGEVFTVRNDLIRHLHKKLGYNTILFESGIGEMAYLNAHKDSLTSERLTHGFFGIWKTDEFRQLMEYVKDEDISIGGYDVQRSGRDFAPLLRDVCERNDIDPGTIESLEQRFASAQSQVTSREANYDSIHAKVVSVIQEYSNGQEALTNGLGRNVDLVSNLVLHTLENRKAYLRIRLQFVLDGDWNQRWASRDSAMAVNVNWIAENFFPNEKLILIGHNFHIARYNEKEDVMGEFLTENWNNDMVSIGIFGGPGNYRANNGSERTMDPPDPDRLDVRHLIDALPGRVHFMSTISSESSEKPWIDRPIVVNNSFIDLSGSDHLVLSSHFDGVILVDKVSMPKEMVTAIGN